MSSHASLLELRDLHAGFSTDHGWVRAVDGVSFEIARGEVVALVGESGCGKSATSLAIMRLLPEPHGRIDSGKMLFDGADLVQLSPAQMRGIRGNRIAMIFQDPMTSLNPYLTIDEQLSEVSILHLGVSREQARRDAVRLLDRVGLPDPERQIRSYPHELSGGMRQRVMIAMALLCKPELLIADEPTTALDVTTQSQILQLLLELRRERQLSIMLITHDLGIVAETCDRVLVMYAGRIVESAPASALFERPHHPYTLDLLRSVPRVEQHEKEPLKSIRGLPPRLDQGRFEACTYAPRCRLVKAECRQREPELSVASAQRMRRCILPTSEVQ